MPARHASMTRHHVARRRERAFTLIEVLVVLVIIAVITAVSILSFGLLGDDRDLEREARRLASLIELANDEATIQGRDFGIEMLRQGYRFVEYDPLLNRWYVVLGDDLLRAREIDEQSEFELFVEDRRVLLDDRPAKLPDADDEEESDRDRDDGSDSDYTPHVMIMSSGDMTPFELTIQRQSDRATVTLELTPAGAVEIRRDDSV